MWNIFVKKLSLSVYICIFECFFGKNKDNLLFTCQITSNAKIQQLERLQKDSSLNASIDLARRTYQNIPEQVAEESSQFVAGIGHVLTAEHFSVSIVFPVFPQTLNRC